MELDQEGWQNLPDRRGWGHGIPDGKGGGAIEFVHFMHIYLTKPLLLNIYIWHLILVSLVFN